jgi:hypothetical protein
MLYAFCSLLLYLYTNPSTMSRSNAWHANHAQLDNTRRDLVLEVGSTSWTENAVTAKHVLLGNISSWTVQGTQIQTPSYALLAHRVIQGITCMLLAMGVGFQIPPHVLYVIHAHP